MNTVGSFLRMEGYKERKRTHVVLDSCEKTPEKYISKFFSVVICPIQIPGKLWSHSIGFITVTYKEMFLRMSHFAFSFLIALEVVDY